jgi:Family of unknown function (DUF5677)
MISELGFLSPEVGEYEKQFTTSYCDLFELSEQLSKLLIRLLKDATTDDRSTRAMVMHALAASSLELFQSSIILLRKGCIPGARIICRTLIETVYKLSAIQLTSDGIDRYLSQEKNTRLQKLICIQKYKQKHKSSGVAPGIEKEIDALTKDKKGELKTQPCKWAELANMEDFHNLNYQEMSDDTHGNIESLNHYFDDKSDHIMSFGPSNNGLPNTAYVCHRALINCIEKYALFQQVSVAEGLSLLSGKNDELGAKYCRS